MAGSQLKQLKEALKSKGLVGQTNVKRKNKKAAPSETRKDQEQKRKEIGEIRDNFNQFDKRINRAKHDYTVISGGKFVKAGSKQHNDASKTHSSVEQAMRLDYEAQKKGRFRAGGVVDKRFGEKNKDLTEEEKMLHRFTRERQSGAKNVFALGSDDEFDDDEGFALTHSGKALAFDADADAPAAALGGVADTRYVDEDAAGPPRKKSKKDVMAEVIAKSKFYKRQRQQAFEKTQDEISGLDDEFRDVIGEMDATRARGAAAPKSQQDIDYDNKVRELTYERRAVPADRTKTDAELAQEHRDKMRQLEEARVQRMSGAAERGDTGGDDLGDDFWAGSDGEQGAGGADDVAGADEAAESDGSEAAEYAVKQKKPAARPVKMPATHGEFLQQTSALAAGEVEAYISQIQQAYHPRLAEGNKQKLDRFVGILFEHVLHVSNAPAADAAAVDALTRVLRQLAEKYNEALVSVIRATLAAVETRIRAQQTQKKDLVLFVVLGYLFSTSDHYHLVVTPALILMNQFLCVCMGNAAALTPQLLGQGLMVCDILLSYQAYAKRFDPEVVKFVETCMQSLLPAPGSIGATLSGRLMASGLNLPADYKPAPLAAAPLAVSALFAEPADASAFKFQLVGRCVAVMDRCVATWREQPACVEVVQSFATLCKAAARHYSAALPQLRSTLERFDKLAGNMASTRLPLALQDHKKLAIKTLAPQFEENFNPDKKSYDINRERQELNKMAAQIKKERKSVVKDIRKQTKFVARQQIEEKKDMYEQYHRKMANIVNSISTVEGAEKNKYEREKKRRQGQR